MAKIVFIMDAEEGHLIASFGLAHSLKENGHSVIFLSIIDNQELIEEQGFEVYPLFENIYYKGYKKEYKRLAPAPGAPRIKTGALQDAYTRHINASMNGALDKILSTLNADLYIVSFFLQMDMLVMHYRYGINPVIFTSAFRDKGVTAAIECSTYLGNVSPDEIAAFIEFIENQGIDLASISQLTAPFNSFAEIMVCPQEFDIGDQATGANVYYIGPSIRKVSQEQDIFSLYQVPADKKIIYGSLGSQLVRYGETCKIIFEKIITAMTSDELGDLHLVLSVGAEFDIESLDKIPSNVSVVRWVPQIDVLKVAAAAIIHGGLGSVKECIYFGVPMIVFPLGFDQPANAKRVAYHKLGIAGNIETVSAYDIRLYLLELMTNADIKSGIRRMQTIFHERETSQIGVRVIESLLKKHEKLIYH
ncbi:MAG: nucleotide disphospho-sugar-binding domain-containing protein [Chitinophagaceae bacterium]